MFRSSSNQLNFAARAHHAFCTVPKFFQKAVCLEQNSPWRCKGKLKDFQERTRISGIHGAEAIGYRGNSFVFKVIYVYYTAPDNTGKVIQLDLKYQFIFLELFMTYSIILCIYYSTRIIQIIYDNNRCSLHDTTRNLSAILSGAIKIR